ncbi:MAG TPA: CYTH domain-containing protein [Candidatus Ozemobacteraceae bacterium]|nr:CYTH domain-containing protein [Candidatus Ozemobacteraceae bacterium]
MAKEIERKFLVRGEDWKAHGPGVPCRQGYLSRLPERTVRVRVLGNRGYLTVKGATIRASRPEFEYEIPVADAKTLLAELCEKPLIEKRRFVVEYAGRRWEVDEFFGENLGLVVAEVELESEDAQIELPPWVDREVTDDPRFYNASLAAHPYRSWKTRE